MLKNLSEDIARRIAMNMHNQDETALLFRLVSSYSFITLLGSASSTRTIAGSMFLLL
jgi:hypothetical protein